MRIFRIIVLLASIIAYWQKQHCSYPCLHPARGRDETVVYQVTITFYSCTLNHVPLLPFQTCQISPITAVRPNKNKFVSGNKVR